jgi:hypothetical protein
VSPGEVGKGHSAAQLQRHRSAGDPAAVETVCRPSGDKRQQEQGNELDKADDSEAKRSFLEAHRMPRDVIDLPADHDDHGHLGDRRRQTG